MGCVRKLMFIIVIIGLMVGLASEAALASTASAASQILSEAPGLNANVLSLGLDAYLYAKKHGVAVKKSLLTIVDYSLPSSQKRLWVIDLKTGQVLNTLLVAQGKNTGYTQAKYFSNQVKEIKDNILLLIIMAVTATLAGFFAGFFGIGGGIITCLLYTSDADDE